MIKTLRVKLLPSAKEKVALEATIDLWIKGLQKLNAHASIYLSTYDNNPQLLSTSDVSKLFPFTSRLPSSLRKTLSKQSRILMIAARKRSLNKLAPDDISCIDSFCLEVIPPQLKSHYFEVDSETFTLDLDQRFISFPMVGLPKMSVKIKLDKIPTKLPNTKDFCQLTIKKVDKEYFAYIPYIYCAYTKYYNYENLKTTYGNMISCTYHEKSNSFIPDEILYDGTHLDLQNDIQTIISKPLPISDFHYIKDPRTRVMGIDLGIKVPAVSYDSSGRYRFYGNGREMRYKKIKYEQKIKVLSKKQASAATNNIKNWLLNQDHKTSRAIIDEAVSQKVKIIYLENLNGLRKNINKKSYESYKTKKLINSWSYLRLANFIKYKAREFDIEVVEVNPAYTSQYCPRCRKKNKPTDRTRDYICSCGLNMHRDKVGAFNIVVKGLSINEKLDDLLSDLSPELLHALVQDRVTTYPLIQ